MGSVLRIVGALWAALGVYLIVSAMASAASNMQAAASVVIWGLVFVLPGLGLMGIGSRSNPPANRGDDAT